MSTFDATGSVSQHRDRFRGRCAMALDYNSKVTSTLANAIRVSPMHGCTDLGAINICREHMTKVAHWLDMAEASARAIQAAESPPPPDREAA